MASRGFETNIAYRDDRPKEKATAEAFQQALGKVGIKVTPKPLPSGDYFSGTCGLPSYVVKNNIGLCANGWGADWNDGFGFLSQIVDSRVIRETGGSSNTSVRIPEVDTMLDEAKVEQDEATRNKMWGEIDKRGHGAGGHLPGRLRQGRAAAVEEHHERVHQRGVRLLRLHRDGCEAVASPPPQPHRR